PKILAGSTTQFNFKVLDPYAMNITVSPISYDFSVLEGENGAIYHQIGKTTDSSYGDNINVAFPSNYTGSITIAFEDLNGSSFSATEFPATVNSQNMATSQSTVPEFPLTTFVVLGAMLGLVVSLSKMSLFKSKQI
ncbi:MAG: hypothetical protein WA799_08775, partial [Nitrosotalea sp.]